MDFKPLYKEIEEIQDIGINVSYIIKIVQDACLSNDMYDYEAVIKLAFEKQEQMLEKISNISLEIYSLIRTEL